jgi:ArsR family transcriptional regulator
MAPDLDLLAEATRRHILALIAGQGELCVCELVAALGESQPGVSRHLALLREGGWLAARREGTFAFYRIDAIPRWAAQIVDALARGGVPRDLLRASSARLAAFAGGPVRAQGRAP